MGGWLEKKIAESDGIGEGEGGRMVGGEDNRERWNRRRRDNRIGLGQYHRIE